jgi:hypothetical protein
MMQQGGGHWCEETLLLRPRLTRDTAQHTDARFRAHFASLQAVLCGVLWGSRGTVGTAQGWEGLL